MTSGAPAPAARACVAVLVAAPASGQGKTTVAAALARLHARQGRTVRAFKCGPDFLDPHWLALATGAPVHSLDLWMTGEADCRARLHAAAEVADLVIVEGVMGLFDGSPSAADLAERFGLPVLAVIDARAMAGTFGALAFGLQHFRPGLPWFGVLANRVASERHAGMLKDALRESAQWLGGLPKGGDFALPERHLGLVGAAELDDPMVLLDAAADALAATPLGQRPLDSLPAFRVDASVGAATAARAVPQALLAGRHIAIARDAAFSFTYPANIELLQVMGARLSFFSPLAGDDLPDCDAVWLPGGYPELHAGVLSARHALRDALTLHVAAGRPIWAECGGMMSLFETLVTADGSAHAMWGLLPGRVSMHKRLAALGPQQLDLQGTQLRGHTFHYSSSDTPLVPAARTSRPGTEQAVGAGEAVYVQGSVRGSYFHAWFPSSPEAAARLFLPDPIEFAHA